MPKLFIIFVIAFAAAGGEARAQAARVPVGLRMTLNGAEARLGATVPLTIGLRNFKGEPVPATDRLDVAIESSLPAAIEKVTIPHGKDSVTTAVVRSARHRLRLPAGARTRSRSC